MLTMLATSLALVACSSTVDEFSLAPHDFTHDFMHDDRVAWSTDPIDPLPVGTPVLSFRDLYRCPELKITVLPETGEPVTLIGIFCVSNRHGATDPREISFEVVRRGDNSRTAENSAGSCLPCSHIRRLLGRGAHQRPGLYGYGRLSEGFLYTKADFDSRPATLELTGMLGGLHNGEYHPPCEYWDQDGIEHYDPTHVSTTWSRNPNFENSTGGFTRIQIFAGECPDAVWMADQEVMMDFTREDLLASVLYQKAGPDLEHNGRNMIVGLDDRRRRFL